MRTPWIMGFVAILALIGCAKPVVVQIAPGTYMISAEDKGGVFGNAAAMKANVIRQANEFAAKNGKLAIAVSTHETPMGFGHFATFDYQFRLVDKDSPEAGQVNILGPMPTVSMNKTETKDTTTHPVDKYAELERLGELHKKGILTDAEFDAEKKKILGEK